SWLAWSNGPAKRCRLSRAPTSARRGRPLHCPAARTMKKKLCKTPTAAKPPPAALRAAGARCRKARRPLPRARLQKFAAAADRSLIQPGIPPPGDEYTGERQPLLLTDGENFFPVHLGIQAAESLRDIWQANSFQKL